MKGKFKIGVVILLMVSLLAGLIAGCKAAPPPEKKAEKVTMVIAGIYDLTGPYSGSHTLCVKAYDDCLAWVNETEYIPGVRLVHKVYDHGSDVKKGVACYKAAIATTPTPVLTTCGLQSPIAKAIKPLAERARILGVDGTSARPVNVPPGWIIEWQPEYEGLMGGFADWVKSEWKPDSEVFGKIYKDRPPRLGVIAWEPVWRSSFGSDEVIAYIDSIGVEYKTEWVPIGYPDYSAELLRLKDWGADCIYIGAYPAQEAKVLKDADRLGMTGTFVPSIFWYSGMSELVTYVPKLIEGVTQLTGYQPLPEDWEPFIREDFENSGLPPMYTFSYSAAAQWLSIHCEIIKKTIDMVGIDNVNGEACYNAAMTITDFLPWASSCKMTWRPDYVYGPRKGDVFQYRHGTIVRVTKDVPIRNLIPGGKDVPK